MTRAVIDKPLEQHVLDLPTAQEPSCFTRSATYLFAAAKKGESRSGATSRAGLGGFIVGMDIHPVACDHRAGVTYLLALGATY